MCEILEQERAEGRVEGIRENLISLIRKKVVKNMTSKEISELFELEENYVIMIMELMLEKVEATDEELASTMYKSELVHA